MLYDADEVDVIGGNEAAVLTHIYKIVYDLKVVEALVFIMPNELLNTSVMANYIVSVRDVEDQAGFDFLKSIKNSVEDVVEDEKALGLW